MDINISELTLYNVALWPAPVKLIFILIIFLGIVFSGYWFDSKTKLTELSLARSQENVLVQQVDAKQKQVSNLNGYRKQLNQVENLFKASLRQLPKRSEIPDLLEGISKMGLANGLSFKLFKPEPEVKKEFYSELPIRIAVVGDYHQLAQFISELSSLDRVVTLHNFTLRPLNSEGVDKKTREDELGGKLLLVVTAKTYRYISDSEKSKDKREEG